MAWFNHFNLLDSIQAVSILCTGPEGRLRSTHQSTFTSSAPFQTHTDPHGKTRCKITMNSKPLFHHKRTQQHFMSTSSFPTKLMPNLKIEVDVALRPTSQPYHKMKAFQRYKHLPPMSSLGPKTCRFPSILKETKQPPWFRIERVWDILKTNKNNKNHGFLRLGNMFLFKLFSSAI